jgi:hypothetical protein
MLQRRGGDEPKTRLGWLALFDISNEGFRGKLGS